jgi:plasmid stability protein
MKMAQTDDPTGPADSSHSRATDHRPRLNSREMESTVQGRRVPELENGSSLSAFPFLLSFCSRRHYRHCVKTVCLTIRDCPVEIHRALSQRAAAHRRSLNSEVIVLLESALETPRMSETELRQAIRSVPSKARLSLTETRAAIHEGRK